VDDLHIEQRGHTLEATVGRDEFSFAMIHDLTAAVARAASTPAIRFVRIRGQGDVFCVGRERGARTAQDLRSEARDIVGLNETLRTSPLTIVSEINGDAAGFGAGIVASSDVAIASRDARLRFPEILAGLAPAVVISWLVPALPHKAAFDMVATGDAINADDALRLGLITKAVPADTLERTVDEHIERLAGADPIALREIKQFFVAARTMDPVAAAAASVDALTISALRLAGSAGPQEKRGAGSAGPQEKRGAGSAGPQEKRGAGSAGPQG
jgi:methylglutaconyl-CoA hydratase